MRAKIPGTRGNQLSHHMAVQMALALLADNKVNSKAAAAKAAGIDVASLKPAALARFAHNSGVAKSAIIPDPLTITASVKGKRMSLREALSNGAESAIEILGIHGKNLKRLSKAQDAQWRRAKAWLEMCKSCGLFAPPPGPSALPAELANHAPAEPTPEGALSSFLEDGESSAEDEGISEACKVDDKP